MATWTNNTPGGTATTRRRWNLEDRASLNNLKYHIAAEGCSEVQFDLARQLLNNPEDKNEVTSYQKAVQWLVLAANDGHEEAVKLLRKCFVENRGITAENETEVRECLAMSPGCRAARKAARELFACLSNGSAHITPRQLECKMRKIYNLQKSRGRGNSTSASEEDEYTDDESNQNARRQGTLEGGESGVSDSVENRSNAQNANARSQEPKRRLKRRRRNVSSTVTESHCYSLDPPYSNRQLITEENLVSAAATYSAGHLPSVSNLLVLSVPDPGSLDHVPCFHRLLFHPIIFFTLLYHRMINFIDQLPALLPSNVRLALAFLIYFMASSANLTHYLPLAIYYGSLATMIWSTCRMLKTKHDFIDFRIWSGLFLSYGDHVEADISENRFLKNNLKPYLYFFLAFFTNLMVHPFVVSHWLMHSEITIVSCIFLFVSLFTFMFSSPHSFPDWVVCMSFASNVLAKYPYEMDDVVTTWRFLDLKFPTFCSFVIGNGIEFCLNCRTALYLIIPAFLIHLAKRSNWHGTYTYLIPHCVTLSWLNLCIISSQNATMFGVVRSTFGLAGVLLFLPLFGIVSLLIPVFLVIDWLGFTDPNIRLGSMVIAIVLALLTSCYLAINRSTRKYVTVLQMLICVIAACILTFPYMTSEFKDTNRFNLKNIVNTHSSKLTEDGVHMPIPSATQSTEIPSTGDGESLSWSRFYELCSSQNWEQHNKIKTQLRCSHLDGMMVTWEGTVLKIEISKATNLYEEYIKNLFPNWLAELARCLLGVKTRDKLACDPVKDSLCSQMQRIIKRSTLPNFCSLHNWNSYEYQINVRMSSSGILSNKIGEVALQASHIFGNFSSHLAAGDEIRFLAKLRNSQHTLWRSTKEQDPPLQMTLGGSTLVFMELIAIECRDCFHKNIPAVINDRLIVKTSPLDARMRDLMRGFKYLLNVFFNPLITFK